MNRLAELALVEALVLAASEKLADDAEACDALLGEALARFNALPARPYADHASLDAARQLVAACEALTDRLVREKTKVRSELSTLEGGREATRGYGAASASSSFARVG